MQTITDLGYNIIALPKEGIKPLSLLSEEKDYVSLVSSSIQDLFEADEVAIPITTRKALSIQCNYVFSSNIEAGFSFLEGISNFINFRGGGNVRGYSKEIVSIEFLFYNITEKYVDHLLVDNFLTGAIPLEAEFVTYSNKLKNSELFTITSVLYSKNFTVRFLNKAQKAIEIQADLQNIVEGNININQDKDQNLMITYKGSNALAFAFKAVKILYDKKKWFEFWNKDEAKFRIKNQLGLVMRSEEDFPTVPLAIHNNPINI